MMKREVLALRSDTFLSIYRVLEGLLNDKYSAEDARGGSVIMTYINDAESEPVRAKLDICRQIRNLLTHNADGDGEALIEPSANALNDLYAIVEYVQSPQPALKYATRIEDIMLAYPNEKAMDVMRRMEKNGYSHAPIARDSRLDGVFSVTSVFSYALKGKPLTESTRVHEFGNLLRLDAHRSGRFMFLPESASYLDARNLFEGNSQRNNRLAAVFLTDNGLETGRLLGMLTPWDVMNDKPLRK